MTTKKETKPQVKKEPKKEEPKKEVKKPEPKKEIVVKLPDNYGNIPYESTTSDSIELFNK